MLSSLCSEPDANGTRLRQQAFVPPHQPIAGFLNGLRRACLKSSGGAGCSNMISSKASNGNGFQWMALSQKPRWAEKKTGPNPTDRAKSGSKRSVLTDGRGVPLALEADGANPPDVKLARPTLEGI